MIYKQTDNLLGSSVIYIGGVSAAGKTTVVRSLSKRIMRPAISLDNYSNLINNITKDQKITKPVKADIAQQIVEDLIYAGSTCIVEGVWIKPDVANEIRNNYRDKFTAIYCGYPDLNPEEHLSNIKDKNNHWLAHEPQSSAISFITNCIEKSLEFKEQCQLYGFPFIDFSDQEKGSKQLLSLFENERLRSSYSKISYSYTIKDYN